MRILSTSGVGPTRDRCLLAEMFRCLKILRAVGKVCSGEECAVNTRPLVSRRKPSDFDGILEKNPLASALVHLYFLCHVLDSCVASYLILCISCLVVSRVSTFSGSNLCPYVASSFLCHSRRHLVWYSDSDGGDLPGRLIVVLVKMIVSKLDNKRSLGPSSTASSSPLALAPGWSLHIYFSRS